ncbi:MAG: hypothetical protein M3Z08_10035 [Chloroflexota bacterium]|nr:hypothetical protein [Chloroflexota bacterium]
MRDLIVLLAEHRSVRHFPTTSPAGSNRWRTRDHDAYIACYKDIYATDVVMQVGA